MAKVTTAEQARDIAHLDYVTKALKDNLDQLKVPRARSPYLSEFDIENIDRVGSWPEKTLFNCLNKEDKTEVNRFIVNRLKRRLRENQTKLKKMGIKQ